MQAMKKQGGGQSPAAILQGFAQPYRGKFMLSIVLAVVGVAAGFVPYFAVAEMIVRLLEGNRDTAFYLNWCLVAAGGYIVKVLLSSLSTTISHAATYLTLKDIRSSLVSKLSRMPMGSLLDTPSGRFKETIVDRVEGLETTLAHLLPELIANVLVPLALIAYLFALDWRMALVSLITLPIGMCFVSIMAKTYPAKYAGSVETSKRMNSAIVEYVNGIEVIKAFNQDSKSYQKYSDAVVSNARYFYEWMKSCQWPMSAYSSICPAVLITVLPMGAVFYMGGSLSTSQLIMIIILSLGIVGPIIAISHYIDSIASMGTVVGQIGAILHAPELIRPEQRVQFNHRDIELMNVTFAYHEEEEPVLHGVNLTIKEGSVAALVGPSGSGKSTIAKLIAGYWDVTGGSIAIGGVRIGDIPQSQLADQIAYVSQDNYLFDDTVRENIRMGRQGASDLEVEEAAVNAGCDDFIRGLEKGYDTVVGGAGSHLSGGERQRIAIARAMLRNAPIVILDEATAYTDPENEALIQKSVSRLVAGKTLIVIAHRLSTIVDADEIVLVNYGRISATGTHEELLAKSPLYEEMWEAHIGARDGEE